MHPTDCPSWEYSHHPEKTPILHEELKSILLDLRSSKIDSLSSVADSRAIHQRLFWQLTPTDCDYYAGHYRGEDFRCLKYIQVFIQSDPRVGFTPDNVLSSIDSLAKSVDKTVDQLDKIMASPDDKMALRDKIVKIVTVACRFFEIFLRIHPYVNGNGHIARFCLCSLLGRYGFWPTTWSIDPRPQIPNYTQLIVEYRNGNTAPLENYIMGTLIRRN